MHEPPKSLDELLLECRDEAVADKVASARFRLEGVKSCIYAAGGGGQ